MRQEQAEPSVAPLKLSEDDVLRRLFAPATNLPEPRGDKAIVAVSNMNERAVTHRQIENAIAYAAEQLETHGVKAGDKVVLYCENSPELSSTILACWALNAMVALVDFRAEREAVLKTAKKLDAKVVVTSKKMYKDIDRETAMFTREDLDVLEVSALADFKNAKEDAQVDISGLNLDAHAFTILTSGTTGPPKASVHTLRSLVANIIDLAEFSQLQGDMTALTPLPISHIYGLSVFLVAQVLGIKTVLTTLEAVPFVKAIHKFKPELIAALPQFYGGLMAAPKGYIKLSNAKLLLCGGAPLTVSLAEKFEATFGKKLNNGYGSTESKIVALNLNGPALSVGKPIGSVKIDIVNEQDEVLPDGEIGEVRIRSEMLMDGYLNDEEKTREVLHDGSYYTGDIGRIEDGHLFVVGRKGDIIIVGGSVVHAGEIEEVLRKNPAVKDAVVTPVPNNFVGQIIKATVVLMDDKIGEKLKSDDKSQVREAQRQLTAQFKAYCEEHLTRYQRPLKWEFRDPHDSLPKTLAGKVDKRKISEPES